MDNEIKITQWEHLFKSHDHMLDFERSIQEAISQHGIVALKKGKDTVAFLLSEKESVFFIGKEDR